MAKHARELEKVWSPGRAEAIVLVEATLAVMRLSCEKFFVLAAVLAAHLLWRDQMPGFAMTAIRANHRISTWFQKVCFGCEILTSFAQEPEGSAGCKLAVARPDARLCHNSHARQAVGPPDVRACSLACSCTLAEACSCCSMSRWQACSWQPSYMGCAKVAQQMK